VRCALWLAVALFACGEPDAPREVERSEIDREEPWSDAWLLAHAPPYLGDRSARREALLASLTNRANLYSRTRIGAYGHGSRGWDALPEWRPRSMRIDASLAGALARGERPPIDAAPIGSGARPSTMAAWIALGERVFFELPLRSEPFWEVAIRDPARGEALGVERARDGSFPGLVWMRDTDGENAIGITCALCHASRGPDGAIVAGRARRRLDYGGIRIAYYEARGEPIEARSRARWESWGPGRADVLEDVSDTPIAITDLYGLRHQRLLTQAGTLTHESPLALAIRQETQYIQANHHHTRPPRELMFALAMYLYSIEPPAAPPFEGPAAERTRGALLFGEHCARCHGNRAGSGELVPIEEIATDPELATGGARGTGGYRPAPLIRVADAAPYLHHGSIASLDDLLSPDRTEPGHRFGTELAPGDRALLARYLRSR
jgi:mono/diheme cytochrome c family protein